MNTRIKGQEYEDFVASVYGALMSAEKMSGIVNLCIEKHKRISDASGVLREIDIYWEYELLGQRYTTAIECKNYKRAVGIDKVEAFSRKIRSLNINKGIIVASSGFQSGAISAARSENVTLLVVRKRTDEDWDGYMKTMHIHYVVPRPPVIRRITPKLDKEWVEMNAPHLFASNEIIGPTPCDEIIIDDISRNERFSLDGIAKTNFSRMSPGKHTWRMEFDDAYFECPGGRYKMKWIEVEYSTPNPITATDILDFSGLVLGIMEYIGEEKKKVVVLSDGQKKPY